MNDVQRVISGGAFCGNEVSKAVRRGTLKPAREFDCVDCDGPARDYDHRDYNEPLVVEPVCRSCNKKRGAAIPRRWQEGELLAILRRGAERLRIVPWAVQHCQDRIEFVLSRIERHTQGRITRHELRADLFPTKPPHAAMNDAAIVKRA